MATPLIASWPNGIGARGELRDEMGHCIDFLPTILELAGMDPAEVPLPDGAPPLPGQSLVPALTGEGNAGHSEIYFHHSGNRALRVGDWKIVSAAESGPIGSMNDEWALYNMSTDRCEMMNLADDRPERCRELRDRWYELEETYRRHGAEKSGG